MHYATPGVGQEVDLSAITFSTYRNGDKGLVGRDFYGMAVDENGYYWICANFGSGLFRFDGYEFINFTTSKPPPYQISDNSIRYVYEDEKGFIWSSTRYGLNKLDPYTLEIERFYHDPEDSTSISGNYLEPVFQGSDETVWIGANNGLNAYDPMKGTFSTYALPMIGNDWFPNFIMSIAEDKLDHRKLLLASNDGIRYFNKNTLQFQEIPIDIQNPEHQIDRYAIFGLEQSQDGNIYLAIGGTNLMFEYDHQLQRWNSYELEGPKNINHYYNNAVYDFHAMDDDHLWISATQGIFLFDRRTKTFSLLPMEVNNSKSAISSAVRQLNTDHYGRLILPSLLGISVSNELDFGPRKELANRYVGINRLSHGERHITPKITNRYSKGKQPIYQDDISFEDGDSIIITYSLPNPMDIGQIQYEYRINGGNWIPNQHSNTLTLSSLQGEKYWLQIRAKESNNHEWIESPKLFFNINHFFFETLWFKVLLGAFLIGLIALYMNIRIKFIRREEKLKSRFKLQIAEVEMEALRAQMNPHFLFNTMNSINHFILKNESEEASYYLTKFSRLVRQTLNNSKAKTVSVEDEIDVLKLYLELEQLRFQNKFDYDILVEDDVPLAGKVPPMIIQPFIENSIWHGLMHKETKGKLDLSFSMDDGQLIVSVRDNGIGREKAKQFKSELGTKQKSFGMQITKNRLDLIQQIYKAKTDIEVIDHYNQKVATGTEVIISIPIILN